MELNKILTHKLAEAIQKLIIGTISNNNKYSNEFSTKQAHNNWQMDPMGYCWTHGYKVRYGHNSTTCTNKRKGHKMKQTEKMSWEAARKTNIGIIPATIIVIMWSKIKMITIITISYRTTLLN